MIYAIRNKRTRSVKLGYSREPKTRVKGLQTAHEDELVLEACVHGGKKLEEHFHDLLAHEQIRGEWFRGPKTETVVFFLAAIGPDQRRVGKALQRLLSAPLERRLALMAFVEEHDWDAPQDLDANATEIDRIMGWDDELSP